MEPRARPIGRPARVSRRSIAEAALEVGLGTLTLTSLAQRLGVDHSTLYRHVASRDDIIVLACDTAIARMDWPDVPDLPAATLASSVDTTWRTYLEQACERVWDMYDRYPGLASAIHHLDTAPGQAVVRFTGAIRDLMRMGFAEAEAVLALDTVLDIAVESYVGWERVAEKADRLGSLPTSTTPADEHADAGRRSPATRALLVVSPAAADAEPALGTMERVTARFVGDVPTGSASTPRDWWRRKLALLLAGIAGLRSETGGSPQRDGH